MHSETDWTWLSLPSAAIYLAIAASAVLRSTRSPMAPPLARTAAALFAYEAFEFIKNQGLEASEHWVRFQYLECAAASLVAPTTAALVLTFLGERRRLLWLVVVGASYFSLLSIGCLVGAFVPPDEDMLAWWAVLMLAGLVPEFGYLFVLLFRHAQRSSARERARTQVLALALVLGAGGASTDLASIASTSDPGGGLRLAVFGLLGAALLLAALAFRMDFLEGVRGLVGTNVIAIVAAVAMLQAIVDTLPGENGVLTVTLSVAITAAALATLRPIVLALAEERDRLRYLATMGRFSAQMAHDLKNPLAAIRGAAQFLAEETKAGRSLDPHHGFVDLILEQTDRLAKVVDEYQRVGRAEASRSPVDVSALLERVAEGARLSWSGTVKVAAPDKLEHAIDRDLVVQALENLVRNAREAMAEKKGAIELVARRVGTALELAVRDEGPGMDVRTKERALDEFFTTKATGSGLGLAFVSRVAEAHGGRVSIDSTPGVGTTVTMYLPEPRTSSPSMPPA